MRQRRGFADVGDEDTDQLTGTFLVVYEEDGEGHEVEHA
jgi:hypothetical protein